MTSDESTACIQGGHNIARRTRQPRHQWEPIPSEPFDLTKAICGPRFVWKEKCARCGAENGTRRDQSARRKGGYSIVWRDVWRNASGEVLPKRPPCEVKPVALTPG